MNCTGDALRTSSSGDAANALIRDNDFVAPFLSAIAIHLHPEGSPFKSVSIDGSEFECGEEEEEGE